MATEASIGHSSKYAIHDGASPGAFVDLAEVFNITPGADTADRVEVTHMQSPDRRREFIAGLIDAGEATIELNWVPNNATDIMLRGLLESGAVREHRITFPNGVTVTYDASIIGFEKQVPLEDRLTATITVAVSGEQTWAAS